MVVKFLLFPATLGLNQILNLYGKFPFTPYHQTIAYLVTISIFTGDDAWHDLIIYHPFKKYVQYVFSLGGLSMMSHTILWLWLAALIKHDVMLWAWHHARFHKIYRTFHKGLCMTHQILLCPELTSCSDHSLDWVHMVNCNACFVFVRDCLKQFKQLII